LIDSLRCDHLSCYGYKRETSPNIDHFADSSTLFENAITQGNYTIPAVASILTSLFSPIHGASASSKLNSNAHVWPKFFKTLGYKTCAFTSGGYFSRDFNLHLGFDEFHDDRMNLRDNWERIFQWIKKNQNKAFFLLLHGCDVHVPYDPPKEYAQKFCTKEKIKVDTDKWKHGPLRDGEVKINKKQLQRAIDLYDAGINYLDSQLGYFFEYLKQKDLWNSSYIIITSDHGEAFMEHGFVNHGGFNFYDELLKVPLILRGPNLPEGKKIKTMVRHIDIIPTLLDYLGIKCSWVIDGVSLKGLIEETEEISLDCYYEERSKFKIVRAYRNENWKLIEREFFTSKVAKNMAKDFSFRTLKSYLKVFLKLVKNPKKFKELSGIELYNIKQDPNEKLNLANKEKEILVKLKEKMDQFKKRTKKLGAERVTISKDTLEKLKGLGYI